MPPDQINGLGIGSGYDLLASDNQSLSRVLNKCLLSRASEFSVQASKFLFFFMFKNEFRASKFWNLNAKTADT